jgi:hypothetical protein
VTIAEFHARFSGSFVRHSFGRVFSAETLLWQAVLSAESLCVPAARALPSSSASSDSPVVALQLRPLFPLFFWLQIGPTLAVPMYEQRDLTLAELRARLVADEKGPLREFLPSQLRDSHRDQVVFKAANFRCASRVREVNFLSN